MDRDSDSPPSAGPNENTGTPDGMAARALPARGRYLTRSIAIMAAGFRTAAALPSSCRPYCTGTGDRMAPIALAA